MKRTYLPSILLILLTINIVSSKENNSSIKLDYQTEGKISVAINNEPFTTYHYSKDRAKPILYPILGPGGKRMVRDCQEIMNGICSGKFLYKQKLT